MAATTLPMAAMAGASVAVPSFTGLRRESAAVAVPRRVPAVVGKRAAVVASAESDNATRAEILAAAAASRRQFLTGTAAAAAAAASGLGAAAPALAGRPLDLNWELVDLPVDPAVVLLDIAFVPTEPNRGYLLGSRQTLLETVDSGKTWTPRRVQASEEEGFNYRFTSISFNGDEGWIIGKPAILLHTTDRGQTWERIPLSAKLPGIPLVIYGSGAKGNAEMVTDQGAIYVTSNAAYTWKAAVQETVDATLNRTVSSGISGASYYTGTFSTVNRSPDGSYVGVSSRGNFYMTWEPGQTYWQPHNRTSARRIQNMGWRDDGGLWLLTRGGSVYLNSGGVGEDFAEAKVVSRGFGILDVGYQSKGKAWAVGGSGSLFQSDDGGRTWSRARVADSIPANLYEVKFVSPDLGFALGNSGILLRYATRA
eukprot:jgi/Chlat1/2096/Chrsp17S02694